MPRQAETGRLRLVTVDEAAAMTGRSRETIYRDVKAGRLDAYRGPYRGIRISVDSIDAFMTPVMVTTPSRAAS
jgi:excisionase family DNA binding protein